MPFNARQYLQSLEMDTSSTRRLVDEPMDRDLEAGPTPAESCAFFSEASSNHYKPSQPLSLITGTGFSLYKSLIIPAITQAQQEVILVTCFWADSATRSALRSALLALSAKASETSTKIRVQICFSSKSLARNMLLPTPQRGQIYSPSKWAKLGLPDVREIPGLQLNVTRKFFWPFGIIHSKYVIIDRELAIFPSCNISWERWFETAISMRGPVVDHLLSFHTNFWLQGEPLPPLPQPQGPDAFHAEHETVPKVMSSSNRIPTALLPSPHTWSLLPPHLSPKRLFCSLPCVPSVPPSHPPTPLLTTTSHLLRTASRSIILLTPNVTAPTVLSLLHAALARGVAITICTNENLMTAEQLVTAGSTTPRCLSSLSSSVQKLPGSLNVYYFDSPSSPGGLGAREVKEGKKDQETTAVKLHAKVTIVDDERMLLGSGNMDAASWGTSQELGVLVQSKDLVRDFKNQWPFWPLGQGD
ncbi:uncharacterized protein HMPREF1541_02329 [Cyphellophora europaea CBS 101466]|uniref:PLD phosphodiesterase domain-containing protein n=1 Tax=Cyphellophora europaea (strain CBS 101466) TaxID=1220924 RepID=W2S376_CYPE1|nr:uncharacterized protein HMPREF1541_02329 [Cyphellophora europaea CBS 101466]ETN43171.1 hypothetical protein HMPREF1541_02329 [Cyphellophora europaea CBS 101466]